MVSDFKEYKVSEIALDVPHAMSTGPFGSAISSKFFQDKGVPVIRGGNLSTNISNRMSDDGLAFISEEKANEFKRSTVKSGDLVFTCWGTINQVGLINDDLTFSEYIISNKQMKLTPDPEKADYLFLYYLFSSPLKQSEILNNGIGAAVPGFNLGQLKNHVVNLPVVAEQKRIASVLNSFDNKIRLNNETNQTLEQIAQAIFKSWFVDFEPTKAKIAAREALLADMAKTPSHEKIADEERQAAIQAVSGISGAGNIVSTEQLETLADLFPNQLVESELGEIPEGWEVKSLDKVAHYQNGLALQKFRPAKGEDFLPVLKISQLKAGFADGKEVAKASIKPECIINNGDVVFSWSASLLVDIWCGGKAALNQHLFKVTSQEYPKWFYTMWTKHHLEQFKQIASDKAVTMGHIKRSHLSEAKCVIPTNDFIKLPIIGVLIDKQINTRLESNTLEQLRDSLLPKLLSGELPLEGYK